MQCQLKQCMEMKNIKVSLASPLVHRDKNNMGSARFHKKIVEEK